MKTNQILLLFFVVAALLEILAEVFDIRVLVLSAKPLLMPLLIGWYVTSCGREVKKSFHLLLIAGFFFSWWGDVFLMWPEDYFLFGLASFLVTHIFYTVAFLQNPTGSKERPLLWRKPFIVNIFVVFYAGLMFLLWKNLNDFLVPVLIYGMVIIAMVAAAVNRKGRVNDASFNLVLIGAVSFLISDTIIAVNKFLAPFDSAGVWIMLLYIGGQFLIAKGGLQHYQPRQT